MPCICGLFAVRIPTGLLPLHHQKKFTPGRHRGCLTNILPFPDLRGYCLPRHPGSSQTSLISCHLANCLHIFKRNGNLEFTAASAHGLICDSAVQDILSPLDLDFAKLCHRRPLCDRRFSFCINRSSSRGTGVSFPMKGTRLWGRQTRTG